MTYSYDAATRRWTVDGVEQEAGLAIALPYAANSSYRPLTVSTQANYRTKARMRWIGAGTPPKSPYFLASSSAEATGDSATADNGLGTGSVSGPNENGGPGTTVQSHKPLLKMLKPFKEGTSWFVEMTASASASATSSGPNRWAYAGAGGLTLTPDPRYALVSPSVGVTYKKGAYVRTRTFPYTVINRTGSPSVYVMGIPEHRQEANEPDDGIGLTTSMRADVGLG